MDELVVSNTEDLVVSITEDLDVSAIEIYSRSQNCSCKSSFSPFNRQSQFIHSFWHSYEQVVRLTRTSTMHFKFILKGLFIPRKKDD